MATIKRFKDIQAWQKARREIYKTCAEGHLEEELRIERSALPGCSLLH